MTDPQTPPATVFRTILFQAERTPTGIAVKAPGRCGLTYASLVAFIREIAGGLRGYGGKNVRRIAVIMPQGPEAATAFLAVASFAAAAPLNPDYKGEDLEFFLSDLKADALLIDSQLDSPARQAAERLGIPVIEAIPDPSRAAGCFSLAAGQYAASDAEPFYPSPEETALYLHTSGTTARPKLVPLTQRNLCASAR
ncbi:MAG: AMP-binding protein, partial [Gammaproteobacteria bacterium]